MKRAGYLALAILLAGSLTPGTTGFCVQAEEIQQTETAVSEINETEQKVLEDGLYIAIFDTDSGMFHVNEANDGLGILTVKDGKMILHVSLASKGILNLFQGTADEAQQEGAELLEPTLDQVTYSDGLSEEVYGFDIPVPVIGEEFDLALIGKKQKWYDHKVIVSDPQPASEENLQKLAATAEDKAETEEETE